METCRVIETSIQIEGKPFRAIEMHHVILRTSDKTNRIVRTFRLLDPINIISALVTENIFNVVCADSYECKCYMAYPSGNLIEF